MALQLVFQIINLLWLISEVSAVVKNACPEMVCGNVTVSHPFGFEANCWANESYGLYCSDNTRLFLKSLDLEVLNISLVDGTILVNYPIYSNNNCSGRSNSIAAHPINLEGTPFFFSSETNIFSAVGCNKRAVVTSNQNDTTFWGCDSACGTAGASPSQNNNSCTAPIPRSLKIFNVTMSDIDGSTVSSNYTTNNDRGCAYAFLIQENYWLTHNLSNSNIFALSSVEYLPVVLDWYFDYNTSYYYGYIGNNRRYTFHCDSTIGSYNGTVVSGNRCHCSFGYEGNAYYTDGCKASPFLNGNGKENHRKDNGKK